MQKVPQPIEEAGALYARGRWAEAQERCRAILRSDADHFEALHLLGVIAAQSDRKQEAADLFRRAAALRPRDAAVANHLSKVLLELRRFDEALESYEHLLRLEPDHAEAHNSRGVVLQRLARPAEALASFERAVQLKPRYARAHYNAGVTLRALNRLEEALASYDRSLALRPDDANAHNNRGVVLQDLGRHEEALASFERALAITPNDAAVQLNRGHALRALGKFESARESYERAIALSPGGAEAHGCRGDVLKQLGRLGEALQSYERALAIRPDYAEVHNNRGIVLQALERADEALQSHRRAIALSPGTAAYHHNLANALTRLRHREEALASYARALAIEPDKAWLRGDWLHARMQLCDWRDIGPPMTQALAMASESKRSILPYHALAMTDSPALERRLAGCWLEELFRGRGASPPAGARVRAERIHLGYYSADYHNHATAYLAAELIERHDRARFEVTAFSFGPRRDDPMRERLSRAFDRFVDVSGQTDREVAQLSRELTIDIAVDLKGFTEGARTGIFFERAAPIQVNYLGYPGTLGASFIDYLIADPTVVPAESRRFYAEKIAYLPHSYQPNDRKREIAATVFAREALGLPSEGFVFCCFNNAHKITPQIFDCWMRILRRVDASVLWLLADTATAAANLRREAETRGVQSARLKFASRMPLAQHLARHRAADLFLDTYPYNAHTTASDALWAGLPVLTRCGESFASRVAASLLKAVGLPELTTATPEQYEALALELVADRTRLAGLRQRLSAARETAPLFDTERYTRHLEDLYVQMHERYLRGKAPEHLFVDG